MSGDEYMPGALLPRRVLEEVGKRIARAYLQSKHPHVKDRAEREAEIRGMWHVVDAVGDGAQVRHAMCHAAARVGTPYAAHHARALLMATSYVRWGSDDQDPRHVAWVDEWLETYGLDRLAREWDRAVATPAFPVNDE